MIKKVMITVLFFWILTSCIEYSTIDDCCHKQFQDCEKGVKICPPIKK